MYGPNYIQNKQQTASFDITTAIQDEEIRTIQEEEGLDYTGALKEFARRYEQFEPDEADMEEFQERTGGVY